MSAAVYVGCAGWALRRELQDGFPGEGSHLERYARIFSAVEINSSFYRPHLPQTYARWRDSVPENFRFSVKIPRAMTHERRLAACDSLIDEFASQVGHLQEKLGCLLVQLPPQLVFNPATAGTFFEVLCGTFPVTIVCEPRHPSWFSTEARSLLATFDIDYVAADPPVTESTLPLEGAWIAYFRQHGVPEMYHSPYSDSELAGLRKRIIDAAETARSVWCIFDNTASGHAVPNARELLERLYG
jgi:uncharacterized protein YecE (DUF72 family)